MQAIRSGFYSFLRNYHVKGQVDPIQNALEARIKAIFKESKGTVPMGPGAWSNS